MVWLVEGRLQYRTWQTPDGAKRSAVDVVADRVQFLSRGQNPQAEVSTTEEEEAPVSANKAPAETTAVGGWGLAAKQQDESEHNDAKEEDVEDIPF